MKGELEGLNKSAGDILLSAINDGTVVASKEAIESGKGIGFSGSDKTPLKNEVRTTSLNPNALFELSNLRDRMTYVIQKLIEVDNLPDEPLDEALRVEEQRRAA